MSLFSFGQRESFTESSGRSFVDPSQQPFLDFLRNMAQTQAVGAMGQQAGLQGISQGLLGQGQQFLGNLQGIGSPEMQAAQIGQLGSDLGAFFNEQLMPGIRRGAIGTGMAGGGRQGVAEGVAAGQMGRAFTGGAVDIMGRAQQQRLAASQVGLGSLGAMMGVAGAPLTAAYNPLMQFASILGAPTVLSRQQSRGTASGFEIGLGDIFGG